MSAIPNLSVVIPVLNEEGNIGDLVRQVFETARTLGIDAEVVCVDGHSRDRTREEALAAGARCIGQKRLGYGGALREGFRSSRGEFVVTLDGDGSHPPGLIADLWKNRTNADVVVASRFIPGGNSKAPASRQFLSYVLNTVYSKVLSIPIRDMSSGFRLYRRRVLAPDRYRAETFSIVPEILVRAYADGYSVSEIPLEYAERGAGESHVDLLKFSLGYFQTLYTLWRLRNSVESADYDHRAFYSRIPLQRYWQRKRYSLCMGFLRNGDDVLDIGCGSSQIIQNLPQAVAFDILRRKLRFLRRTNPKRICASTFDLPFADQSFDQVIHSEVLEHVALDLKIFRELNRVMRPGGTLVVGTPDYGRIWWPMIEWFYGKLLPNAYADEHITHYNRGMLIDILADHGFRTIRYAYICGGELIIQAEKLPEAA